MTDRELILAAAKAAGKLPERWRGCAEYIDGLLEGWHPLDDDGEAFRLAVKMEMDVFVRGGRWTEAVRPMCPAVKEPHNGDPCAATRRAIVRAAAEIVRGMA